MSCFVLLMQKEKYKIQNCICIIYEFGTERSVQLFIYFKFYPLPKLYINLLSVKKSCANMQVSLLNQEFIINTIQSAVESKLRNSNEARTFQEQVHFGNEAWNQMFSQFLSYLFLLTLTNLLILPQNLDPIKKYQIHQSVFLLITYSNW